MEKKYGPIGFLAKPKTIGAGGLVEAVSPLGGPGKCPGWGEAPDFFLV